MKQTKLSARKKFLNKTLEAIGHCLLLVEGKKDENALKEIGVNAAIVKAVGKPEETVEKAIKQRKPVVLLFDFDEEGERKNKVFKELFLAKGIACNELLRRKVRLLFGVKTIQEIPSRIRELSKEIEGE